MKVAHVYAVTSGTHFSWKWRAASGDAESAGTFGYFFECAEDARKHGYTAEFENKEAKGKLLVPRPAANSVRSW